MRRAAISDREEPPYAAVSPCLFTISRFAERGSICWANRTVYFTTLTRNTPLMVCNLLIISASAGCSMSIMV